MMVVMAVMVMVMRMVAHKIICKSKQFDLSNRYNQFKTDVTSHIIYTQAAVWSKNLMIERCGGVEIFQPAKVRLISHVGDIAAKDVNR